MRRLHTGLNRESSHYFSRVTFLGTYQEHGKLALVEDAHGLQHVAHEDGGSYAARGVGHVHDARGEGGGKRLRQRQPKQSQKFKLCSVAPAWLGGLALLKALSQSLSQLFKLRLPLIVVSIT